MNAKTEHAVASGAAPVHLSNLRPRNDGTPLKAEWFEAMDVNLSAAERRAATLTTRRTVKKAWQAAWLVRAIEVIDLTTLAGDDTPGRVKRLCAKARNPLRDDLVEALGLTGRRLTTGAVCVYPTMVPTAVKALEGSGIPVASVATGFPTGLTPLKQRLEEIRYAVGEGAGEIDIVITRAHVLNGEWAALYDEVAQMREACGEAHLKAILATGELKTLTNVYKASMVAMQAGADFIKTSTGKTAHSASIPAVRVMLSVIAGTARPIGLKPSGGIRTLADARSYLDLADAIMGPDWASPTTFRFGASGLYGALVAAIDGAGPDAAPRGSY